MDFAMSAKAADYHQRLTEFMVDEVLPAEKAYDEYRAAAGRGDFTVPPIVEELKTSARRRGLWNLFLPAESGLTNLEYAPWRRSRAGAPRSPRRPSTVRHRTPATWKCCTCSVPRAEEAVARTAACRRDPQRLLDDRAGRGLQRRPQYRDPDHRDGDDYVINGRKWWTSGANDPRCKVLIVMGGPTRTQQNTSSSP